MIVQVFSAVVALAILAKIGVSMETSLADSLVLIACLFGVNPREKSVNDTSEVDAKIIAIESQLSKLSMAVNMRRN